MVPTDHSSINSLINKVIKYSDSCSIEKKQRKQFTSFVRLYFSHASLNDLKHRPVAELFGMVHSHWLLVCKPQQSGKRVLHVFNPTVEKDGWHSTHTVIELVTKDMPFVVDSMRMAMNRLDITVHLMVYTGGIQVSRDAAGNVTKIDMYEHDQKNTASVESPVYMEIDRQTDPVVLSNLKTQLQMALDDVRHAVEDWHKIRERVVASIDVLRFSKAPLLAKEVAESIAFLQWLLDDQFTFLGARDYTVVGAGDTLALELIAGSGLGVLRDETHSKKLRPFSELPKAAREAMLSSNQLLVISKTNTLSTVHRTAYTDYIGIKQFNEKGELIGERRIIGLYTSTAYSTHPKRIPFLRHKVDFVLKKFGLPPRSHAGRDLMHILETFPRDDLFQATENELYRIVNGILNLQDRKKISAFIREDAYRRYVSCLVYVPRDSFNSLLIARVQGVLMQTFEGSEATYTTYFYTPVLTRIHYIIRLKHRKRLRYDEEALQARLIQVTKTWRNNFSETTIDYFGEERGNQMIQRYGRAFSAGYREVFTPLQAAKDIEQIEALPSQDALGMTLYRPEKGNELEIKFKLYRYHQTVPLSDALPILENMGLRVMGEQPYKLTFSDASTLWINDFSMTFSKNVSCKIDQVRDIFQETFYQTWMGNADNDLLNGLVLEAQLNWHEIAMLRAYTKYLRQTGFTYSPEYVAETFLKYPNIAKAFVDFFHGYFDPKKQKDETINVETKEAALQALIDDVKLLDEDRIFRCIFTVIKATLRTNFYQRDDNNQIKSVLVFKLSPSEIPGLPLPLPKYEIFVYSPRFEGVHLRAGKVARGGLRWSDRREDFRTEILGLMKAQQVKNSVIVPAGAKGGFVPKKLPMNGTREAILEEAIVCYKGFINGILDVTDNMHGLKVQSPKNTVCRDDADTYLVVAADKGTATFSDIANYIAVDRGFWLADAFASGGSMGYDHKKMGITARGAWIAAERHFQKLGIDLNDAEITVVGIGDLSGDVFGNGMLLSTHLKLVAAFNHLHIFLDPNPDTTTSFEERKRLFNLPRSHWTDYAADKISKGGGVYSRDAKFIPISAEIKNLLDITEDRLMPNELIRAILKARVDMLWNGGIGTYVKASTEHNHQAGDRANDALRIDANELRARVVIEGGNLGLTQLARIEYAKNGGFINTDFIDNSAGVDCSDHEVNIKILLNSVVDAGQLTEKKRNQLLVSMTEAVADLVLHNNYRQNEAVSFFTHLSFKHMSLYANYLDVQEAAQKINRAVEYLPDTKNIAERRAKGLGLTSPEIAVLFSYSKIILKEAIARSDLLSDPVLMDFIKHAFPDVLRKKYSDYIFKHRLRHEILATQLANNLVSHMGIAFVYQMEDETSAPVAAIVRTFIVAYRMFHVSDMYAQIEALDYQIDLSLQYQMMDEIVCLVRRTVRWLLRNYRDHMNIIDMIKHFEPYVKGLYKRLPTLLLGKDKSDMDALRDQLIAAHVPEDLSFKIASARYMYHALNIVQASTPFDIEVYQVARIYFMLVDRLDLDWFRNKINDHSVTHRWSVLAKATFKADLDRIQRELTASVIRFSDEKSMTQRVNTWLEHHTVLITRWQAILSELRSTDIFDFSIISVGIRDLMELAKTAN